MGPLDLVGFYIRGPACSCLGPREPEIQYHSGVPYCFGFDFKAGFDYVTKAGPKLMILWSQLPKYWGYSMYQSYLPSGDLLDSITVDPKGFAREELPHGLD